MEYRLEKFKSGMHYIQLDKKTVTKLTKNNNKRVLCKINNQTELHCALMPKKDGGHLVVIGLRHCKKLKIKEGDFINASFKIDPTDYQFEMPEEFKEVMDTDEAANKVFQSLTGGNKRSLLYLVTLLKTTDKRIERALKIADCLKQGITSPRLIMK